MAYSTTQSLHGEKTWVVSHLNTYIPTYHYLSTEQYTATLMDGKTDGFWNDTRLEKFVVHNYFTDKFYVSLGGYPEQNTSETLQSVVETH